MITQEAHLARILHLVSPLPVTQVPLADALGQTLAANVTASVDLPPWDAAAMDGYAISRKTSPARCRSPKSFRQATAFLVDSSVRPLP